MRYVTIDDYMRICPEGDATQQNLESAEYDIDSLTFNRIIGQGFDRLAERQKELVTRAVCLQADFCANMASCSAIRSPLMRSTVYPCRGINPCWYSRMASILCVAFMRSCSSQGSPTVGWIGGDALEMAAARAAAGLLHVDHCATSNGPESRRHAKARNNL